jgi:hypothetical protein
MNKKHIFCIYLFLNLIVLYRQWGSYFEGLKKLNIEKTISQTGKK